MNNPLGHRNHGETLVKEPQSKWDKESDSTFNFVHTNIRMRTQALTMRTHV